MNELSFLLPHFLKEGRGTVDVYFTRVYNPVWTNPDGMSWVEVLTDESLIGLHVALTPTWNETAYLADYVLPMGLASERHDIHSYEQYDGQWVGFRQPVLRAARERLGQKVSDTREVNPGEVWEENEFWTEMSWRIDPDGSLGIRKYHEAPDRPGERMTVDDYYGWIFDNSVPGLPERAAAEGLTPLEFMRRYGAFEITSHVGQVFEEPVAATDLEGAVTDGLGRIYTSAPKPDPVNLAPVGGPGRGRRGTSSGRGQGGRRGQARVPDPERPAGVLLEHPRAVGVARAGRAHLPAQPRPPRRTGPRRVRADLHLPAAHPDPHAQRELQVAQRAVALQPGLDPPGRRRTDRRGGRAHRRSGTGVHRDRALRGQGLAHRGHPPGRGRVQSPHGPVEAQQETHTVGGQTAATVDLAREGTSWSLSRLSGVAPLRLQRPGHLTDLVDRRRACTRI